MTVSTVEWVPPTGMEKDVAMQWRAFYRSIAQKYGMSPAEYRAVYLAQLGRCFICRKARGVHPDDPKGHGSRRLGVDHHHASGRVRGLLCSGGSTTCNRIIGWLRDDPEAFERGARYLREQPAQSVLALVGMDVPDERIEGMLTRD